MCFNSILPVIPITIGAISGTLMAFMISMLVEKHFKLLTKFLVSIGRETYIIVVFSQIIIMSVNQYLTHNILVKYGLLIFLLIVIKYFKDAVNCFCKTKLL